MLAAFVSLRVFTIELRGYRHPSVRYITKASHQAPHLESFTIHSISFGNNYTFRCKRVNGNWVVCDETKCPAP
jgi:hypothetical protein